MRQFGGCEKAGRFDPISTVAKPGPPPVPNSMACGGTSAVENWTWASLKAARRASTASAASTLSGIDTPQTNWVGYVLDPAAISHCARVSSSESCTANPKDSGSLAIHASTTFPRDRCARLVKNLRCCSADNCLHAAAFIISAARWFAIAAFAFALAASALATPARSLDLAISPRAVSVSLDRRAVSLRKTSNSRSCSWDCVMRSGRNSRSFSQCQIPRTDSPNTPIATKAAKTSTHVSNFLIEVSSAAIATSISSLLIVDDSNDRFFYAFVGLTIFVGLLGLIWPAIIIAKRLRRDK
jgi:hypothetical protein